MIEPTATGLARHRRVDEEFMKAALQAARTAADAGEVPVGAVVVHEGVVLARAHNEPVRQHDPTAHAEVLALRGACARIGNYRLPAATTMYVTVEPCVMCVGAMLHARVARVVFGCREPKAGALGSRYDIGRDGRLNHLLEVQEGVCADEAGRLLKEFFQARRGA